jgi:hypothetical protein
VGGCVVCGRWEGGHPGVWRVSEACPWSGKWWWWGGGGADTDIWVLGWQRHSCSECATSPKGMQATEGPA